MIFKKKSSVDTSTSTSGENAIANKEVEGLSQGQIVRRRFFRHRAAVFSLGVIIFITVFVFSALDFKFLGIWHVKGWWKWSPQDIPELRFGDCPNDTVGCPTISFRPKFMGGSGFGFGDHPFGQDDIGRDFFALVMKGTQRSLSVMIVIGTAKLMMGQVPAGLPVLHAAPPARARRLPVPDGQRLRADRGLPRRQDGAGREAPGRRQDIGGDGSLCRGRCARSAPARPLQQSLLF